MGFPFDTCKREFTLLASRFIGLLIPFDDEKDIIGLLKQVREDYPKATHYPYAARLLPFERYSDEGEPSRSVGLPLLEILRRREVDHGILVVIRYFGGTKLGLGRLTRTYREMALKTLEGATWCDFIEGSEATLTMSYSDFSLFEKECQRLGVVVSVQSFGDGVSLLCHGDAKIVEPLLERYGNQIEVLNKKIVRIKRRRTQ